MTGASSACSMMVMAGPGIAEIFGRRPPEPKIVRVLCRMHGPSRVIVARMERHPFGREQVIAFEDGDDVIEVRRFGRWLRPTSQPEIWSLRLP